MGERANTLLRPPGGRHELPTAIDARDSSWLALPVVPELKVSVFHELPPPLFHELPAQTNLHRCLRACLRRSECQTICH